jgi:hypothetical protein
MVGVLDDNSRSLESCMNTAGSLLEVRPPEPQKPPGLSFRRKPESKRAAAHPAASANPKTKIPPPASKPLSSHYCLETRINTGPSVSTTKIQNEVLLVAQSGD